MLTSKDLIKKVLLITVLFFFFSCNNNSSLKITELNFSDLNQENILKNDIKKTFLISGYDSGIFKKNDTIEIIEYNKIGKVKKVWRKSFMYSIEEEYKYDSLNLETQKIYFTDFKAMFNFRYEFNKDSLILYKYYTQPTIDVSSEDISKPAGVFKFNNNGKIIESFQYQNNDYGKGKKLITTYDYNNLNKLSRKEMIYEPTDVNDSSLKSKAITDYHYSDQKLDSSTTTFSWTDRENQEQSYSTRVVYDDKGLITNRITMDSLITHYKHIK